MADPPVVSILLLGDSGAGKSTFLSYVRSFPRIDNPPFPGKSHVQIWAAFFSMISQILGE